MRNFNLQTYLLIYQVNSTEFINGLVQVQQFKPYIRSHRRPPVMTVQTKKNISVWKPYRPIHYHKDC